MATSVSYGKWALVSLVALVFILKFLMIFNSTILKRDSMQNWVLPFPGSFMEIADYV